MHTKSRSKFILFHLLSYLDAEILVDIRIFLANKTFSSELETQDSVEAYKLKQTLRVPVCIII